MAISDLGHYVGRAGVGIAASLVAYLLGGLIVSAAVSSAQRYPFVPAGLRTGRRSKVARSYMLVEVPNGLPRRWRVRDLTDDLVDRLLEQMESRGRFDDVGVLSTLDQVGFQKGHGVDRQALYQVVWAEAGDLTVKDRMLGRNKEIYQEADRHEAEAELRIGVVAPGLFLCAGVWSGTNLGILLKAFLTIALCILLAGIAYDGLRRLGRSSQILRQAMADGETSGPTLDLLRRIANFEGEHFPLHHDV